MKHTSQLRRIAVISSFGAICSIFAFALGLQTSGNVRPFEKTQAAISLTIGGNLGDIDADGTLTVTDAILILERAEGYEEATAEEIKNGDADGDYRLTVRDALRVLRAVSRQ